MDLHTVGFTKHSAEEFFGLLIGAGVTRLIDVRLRNVSQLAGFAKRDDLEFFLRKLCDADYVHQPLLAPSQELLDSYKKDLILWDEYENRFLELMAARKIENEVGADLFEGTPVLLCSEHSPEHCHRRLVGEYLNDRWGDVQMHHL